MCLDRNPFNLSVKIFDTRYFQGLGIISNLLIKRTYDFMKCNPLDSISDTKLAISWIMVSFLWINRYHFLARWHKPNTYQHIFYPMSSLLLLCWNIYAYDEIMYAEMIQWLSSIDIWRVSFYLLFMYLFLWLPSLMHLD